MLVFGDVAISEITIVDDLPGNETSHDLNAAKCSTNFSGKKPHLFSWDLLSYSGKIQIYFI